jgi:hypothetical protein
MIYPKVGRVSMWIIGTTLLFSVALVAIFASRVHTAREETERAEALQQVFALASRGVTKVRIWAAGARQGNGFCGACSFGRPAVVFESDDLGQIEGLKSSFSFSGAPSPIRPAICGPITAEFHRGEELVLSLNLHGTAVVSTWKSTFDAPLTVEGQNLLRKWLARYGIEEKVQLVRSGRWDGLPK